MRMSLFSVVPTDRTRGNRYKLKHIKPHLITTFTYCKGGQNWNRLPREMVWFPPVGIFKTQLDTILYNLLLLTLLEQRLD